MPAEAGKLLVLRTSAKTFRPLMPRRMSRKALTRARAEPVCGSSLIDNASATASSSRWTAVRVSRAARFMEMEPFIGMRSRWSRLPQYLIKAMLGWARADVFLCVIFLFMVTFCL